MMATLGALGLVSLVLVIPTSSAGCSIAYPIEGTQCHGLNGSNASTPAQCGAACCASDTCLTWVFDPAPPSSTAFRCWSGDASCLHGSPKVLGWDGGSKVPLGSCTNVADCNHNGECVDSACKCRPQFKGAVCDQFNFSPLDLTKGTGLRTVDNSGMQVSSWGGSVHLADDGLYHMW